ncbi:MAG TPA: CDP-diacylglycerol--glycerol-3-phosphate 3-phosphatidyltransferase [Devosiaceae bacterium]|nr:CDP-diacylglycerol--glycerol-3-phosphate 3-phosphatidyltransferase [Devosiaceae bacterium]
MNLPNLLTIGRIAAIPAILLLVVMGDGWMGYALALFVLAAITDYVDGVLARRMDLQSGLGRMLDPIADKMLVGALIVALAATGDLTGWHLVPGFAILMREIFVSGLREYLGDQQVTVPVSTLAKYKTTLQLVATGAIMFAAVQPVLSAAALALFWLAAALTIITGYRYLAGAWPHLTEPTR